MNQFTFTESQKLLLDTAKRDRVLNRTVQVSGRRVEIPLDGRTIEIVYYRPEGKSESDGKTTSPRPLIIGLHGGGALLGGGALNDAMWVDVAKETGADIASVDYRLTPDNRFPDPVMDAYEVTEALLARAVEFGFDPARVYLMGCSSGGNIAAATAILANRRGKNWYRAQMLIYPYLDMATEPEAKGAKGEEAEMFHLFNELYVDPERAADPLVSPLYAGVEELKGLPDTILVTAGRDILRHEGSAYAQKLRLSGIKVYEMCAANMVHAYFENAYAEQEEVSAFGSPLEKKLFDEGSLFGAAKETLRFIRQSAVWQRR